MLELGNGQLAVQEDEAGVVFEVAVRGPLHANEASCEHGEAGVAEGNHGLRVGNRIGGVFEIRGDCGLGGRSSGFGGCSGEDRRGRQNAIDSSLAFEVDGPSGEEDDCGKVKQGSTHRICSLFFFYREGYHPGGRICSEVKSARQDTTGHDGKEIAMRTDRWLIAALLLVAGGLWLTFEWGHGSAGLNVGIPA